MKNLNLQMCFSFCKVFILINKFLIKSKNVNRVLVAPLIRKICLLYHNVIFEMMGKNDRVKNFRNHFVKCFLLANSSRFSMMIGYESII